MRIVLAPPVGDGPRGRPRIRLRDRAVQGTGTPLNTTEREVAHNSSFGNKGTISVRFDNVSGLTPNVFVQVGSP